MHTTDSQGLSRSTAVPQAGVSRGGPHSWVPKRDGYHQDMEPPPRAGCGPVERAGAPSYTVHFARRLEGPPRYSQPQYRHDGAWTSRWVVLPVIQAVIPGSSFFSVPPCPTLVALLFVFVIKSIILCFFHSLYLFSLPPGLG